MSVLVAAHTSAGKTVVAQYAIAKAIKNRQRVIYTSPIKALSNQKYRELESEFQDVGLMTGDVTLNPTATCIVMTTEILRNMLYKGSEITREMAWVIFDEVHYMRDKDRGVVWEETIILLPNLVKYVFLSATIPNANQFAQWICRIKNQPCHIVSTEYRPVPLQHFVYPSNADGIYLVVNEGGQFKQENFNKAISVLDTNTNNHLKNDKENKNLRKSTQENDVKKIISLIKMNNLDPVIVFAFSKKDCEENALSLSKLDFTIQEEKEQIKLIFNNAIKTLSEEDQILPQIKMMLPLLCIGVGIHHGGLLPILKETVELLFQEGLLKVLFSTETFSMGINMPAKTVVFTSIEKYDGETHRWIGGGEYIQMSGRAGRRGLDEKGITIMMLNKKMDTEVCKSILSGKSDHLFSSFRLSYNMIVNLMRIEGLTPDFIVKQSFRQFQSEVSIPELIDRIRSLRIELKEYRLDPETEKLALEIQNMRDHIELNSRTIQEIVTLPENILKFLCQGRFVKISNLGWGILIKFEKKRVNSDINTLKHTLSIASVEDGRLSRLISKSLKPDSNQIELTVCEVLIYTKDLADSSGQLVGAQPDKANGILKIANILLQSIEIVSQVKIDVPKDYNTTTRMKIMQSNYLEICKRCAPKNFIPMDPITDMKITSKELSEAINVNNFYNSKIEETMMKIPDQYKSFSGSAAQEVIRIFKEKEFLRKDLNKLIDKLQNLKETVLNEELIKRKKVLKHFDFINEETVKAKGQVACLISSADEVLLTEMLYHGQLNDVEPDYLAAMLSCFLSEEREQKDIVKPKNQVLGMLHSRIQKSAERVAEVLVEKRLDVDKDKYINSFRPDMMELVLAWANGGKFWEICALANAFEGTIIRIIRRLDELIKQVGECSQLIGNSKLKEKLDSASAKIKRGIVFAASLYLSDGR